MRELRIEAGRRVGVLSDTHWNHRNILAYCLRPWVWLDSENRRRHEAGEKLVVTDEALRAHDNYLVDAINMTLGPDDVLIHAGDVAWNGQQKLAEFRERLKVRDIYVAIGNHDDEGDLRRVFGYDDVAERWLVTVEGGGGVRKAVVDHYPGHSWWGSHKNVWQLYGHVHGAFDRRHEQNAGWSLSMDVGVDSNDFKPLLWHEDLVPLMDKRMAAWKEWAAKEYERPKEKGGMATNGRVNQAT